tara:strand:+ start:368 stop:664 length:297 start_codon:yes stop_codon:yes gene_type:complete
MYKEDEVRRVGGAARHALVCHDTGDADASARTRIPMVAAHLLPALLLGMDLTVYHVNPAHYPAAPINMDTGAALPGATFRRVATPPRCPPMEGLVTIC